MVESMKANAKRCVHCETAEVNHDEADVTVEYLEPGVWNMPWIRGNATDLWC